MVIPVWLLYTMIGTAVASAGYGAYTSYQQGQTQSKLAKYQAMISRNNALVNQQNAEYALKKGQAEAERARKAGEATTARQRALIGKSGVEVAGSPLLILEEQEAENALDVQAIIFNSQMESRGYETASTNLLAQAGEDEFRGSAARTAGNIGAGQNLLSGAEKVASIYK